MKETGVPGENHRPAAGHSQTLAHNVVSSKARMSGIRNYNVSGDRHWLHRAIQLPYNHDHDGPFINYTNVPL